MYSIVKTSILVNNKLIKINYLVPWYRRANGIVYQNISKKEKEGNGYSPILLTSLFR